MRPTNKEMQLLKTCQLYAYVLSLQCKEVSEEISDCAISYDYLIDCTSQLVEELQNADNYTFDLLVNNPDSYYANDLKNWWQMYQEADKLRKVLFSSD